MNTNKLYTAIIVHAIAPLTVGSHTFRLNAPKMAFVLRNVYIGCQSLNVTSNLYEPINESHTQRFSLRMSRVNAAEMFCSPFENFTGPVGGSFPGIAFDMYETGQYSFDNAYFEESILFTLTYSNRDSIDNYSYQFNIGAEIQLLKSIVS